jgi:ATP-dependent RNA helicase DDX23/PRP28
VFVNQRKTCDYVSNSIAKLGYHPTTLHSSKTQVQREAAINDFRQGKYDVLVATDVAGRGIDIPGAFNEETKQVLLLLPFFFLFSSHSLSSYSVGITHVINFDFPKSIEDYTHRIGRTGRAGSSGLATSLLTNDDADIMYDLKQMLQSTKNYVPHELSSHPSAQFKPGSVTDKHSRRETVIFK